MKKQKRKKSTGTAKKSERVTAHKVRKDSGDVVAASGAHKPQDEIDPDALARVLEQARVEADAFLREEYRERLRLCLFGGTGLLFTAVFMGFFINPVFDIEGNLAYGLVGAPIAGILVLWFFRFRCTRCDKIPILPSTMFHFKTMDLPGCPYCGLKFHYDDDDASASIFAEDGEEE